MPSDRAGTIKVCDDKPKPSDGKITICDEKPKPSDGTITICPPECGPEITELTISGDVETSIGSSYGATGGKPPYRYSISAGTIDHTAGTVTDLSGACGTGSVSVSDACENAASMSVLFPAGQWVLQSTTQAPCGFSPNDDNYSCTVFSGDTKEVRWYHRYSQNPAGNCSPTGFCPYDNKIGTHPCDGSDLNNSCVVGGWAIMYYPGKIEIYHWECP
jgi:hypothetical protein